MNFDGLPFDQNRLERLNPESMQRRRPIQKDRMLFDDVLEDVPDFRPLLLDELLRGLDRGRDAPLLELAQDEWLEELQGHLLGKTALMKLQIGPHDDDRTPRIIHALAEQILSEPALLALQRV